MKKNFIKKILTFCILLSGSYSANAQQNDSIEFSKEFIAFEKNYSLNSAQIFKFDSLMIRVKADTNLIIGKNISLLSIINLIDQKKFKALRKDTSGLVTFSSNKNRFVIYTDKNINIKEVEKFARFQIKEQFPNFYNSTIDLQKRSRSFLAFNKKSVEVDIYESVFDQKSGTGTDLPEIFWSEMVSLKSSDDQLLAEKYWEIILWLLNQKSCSPNFLKYYLNIESPSDSWAEKAAKRRKFIAFIQLKCK